MVPTHGTGRAGCLHPPGRTPTSGAPAWRRCAAPRRPQRRATAASLSSAAAGSKRLVPVEAKERLSVPVVQQHDAGAGLGAYMALPVSHFVLVKVPLGAELRRVGGELFEVLVPRLQILGVWVQPRVTCTVRSAGGRVDIRSVALQIEGSDLVQRLRLNERVEFHVRCELSHTAGPAPAIHCQARIDALVDPPAMFALFPDAVLSGTASAVVKASLAALQRTFVPSLAADYARWASSEVYRSQREQHAIQSDAALMSGSQAGAVGSPAGRL